MSLHGSLPPLPVLGVVARQTPDEHVSPATVQSESMEHDTDVLSPVSLGPAVGAEVVPVVTVENTVLVLETRSQSKSTQTNIPKIPALSAVAQSSSEVHVASFAEETPVAEGTDAVAVAVCSQMRSIQANRPNALAPIAATQSWSVAQSIEPVAVEPPFDPAP